MTSRTLPLNANNSPPLLETGLHLAHINPKSEYLVVQTENAVLKPCDRKINLVQPKGEVVVVHIATVTRVEVPLAHLRSQVCPQVVDKATDTFGNGQGSGAWKSS
jgi:hypothetical protein